jgi:hypothetical protein
MVPFFKQSLRPFFAGGIFFVLSYLFPFASAKAELSQPDFRSSQWLALLHQNQGPSSVEAGKPFFLSENGHWDPLAEGAANVIAASTDREWACRFPARAMFLGKTIPREGPACESWWRWKEAVNASSAELVFAAAYINSPSSMYGHTLLKFPRRGKTEGHELLDYTLNFGAVTGDVVGIPYIWKGLTGGFSGIFAMAPFYLKVKEYNFVENRDFWVYPLNLTEPEMELLLAHSYEVREAQFPYYFLKKNCSYFLLDLLEVVRPGQRLTSSFPLWAVPMDTIRILEEKKWMGDKPYWRPSRLTQLEAWRKELSSSEQKEAEELVQGRESDGASSGRVAQAAYELWRFRSEGKALDKKQENRMLSILKGQDVSPKFLDTPLPPTLGHKSSRLSLSFGQREKGEFGELGFRGTLHDLLSSPLGYEPQSELSMGQIILRWERGDFLFQQFDLLRLRSLQASHKWSSPWAWSFRSGVLRAPKPECRGFGCSLGVLQGGVGKAAYVGPVLAFFLPEVEFSVGGFWSRGFRASGGLVSGIQWDFGAGRFMSEAERRWSLWGGPGRTEEWKNELSFDLARNHEVRISSLLQKSVREYKLGWHIFF